jgi:flagellar basal-body rod modification protein FlgD
MTTVTSTTQTQTQSTATSSSSSQAFGEEFNSFIKLLTAQVRNQDPLSPLDSTQFVEQLATFSALEQQVNSNTNLQSIATMLNDMTGLLASQWLGQSVSIEAANAPYTGEDVTFSIDAPGGTERSVLSILDSSGQTVWVETLDPEEDIHTWNGALASGGTATKDDVYTFNIDTYDADGTHLGTISPQIRTKVTSIASENGVLYVNTTAGLVSELASITKI